MSKPRPPQPSLPTNLIQMTPDFLAALQAVAPKKKRSKIWYLVPVVLLAVIGVVAATPSTRAFVLGKLGRGTAPQPSASVAAEPTITAVAPAITSAPASTTLLEPAPASTTLLEPAPASTTLLAPPVATAPPAPVTAAPPASAPPVATGRRKSKWQK